MSLAGSYADRVATLLASPRVVERRPPRDVAWPIAHPEPADVGALYLACDGLLLDAGVRVFGRGELHDVTQWLVLEKALGWADDLVVVGERRDVVIVLDLDVAGARAGGGVLEVGADDLGAFDRVASGLLSYLLVRAGAGEDDAPPPEIAARRAARDGDREALARELARPMYPGQDRLFASLAVELGALHAAAQDAPRALESFAQSVEARVRSVTRDARPAERQAGWRAAAIASRARGAHEVADACEQRARA
jgi:hypothetical protein